MSFLGASLHCSCGETLDWLEPVDKTRNQFATCNDPLLRNCLIGFEGNTFLLLFVWSVAYQAIKNPFPIIPKSVWRE